MKFVTLFFLLTFFSTAEAQFGLERGMSKYEIEALKLGKLIATEHDSYYIVKPKKPQDATWIIFWIGDNYGLVKVRIIYEYDDNNYGDKSQDKYYEILEVLQKKYGEGRDYSHLREGSDFYTSQDMFRASICKDKRVVGWLVKDPTEDIEIVGMNIEATSNNQFTTKLRVNIDYQYLGFKNWLDSKKKSETEGF